MDDLPEAGPLEMRSTVRAFNLMRERLDRFVRDRTAMLAAISHDLRTPITSLRLHAELLEDERTKAKIVAALDEMQRMTEETLAFIREDMRREETRTVDLHALVDSVAADLADLGHEIAVAEFAHSARYPPMERALVACGPVALRRAFRNLLENAGAYGVRATARITRNDAGLHVVIEDEGPGIPEVDLERVFEPFVRLEESRSRDTGGTGLGPSHRANHRARSRRRHPAGEPRGRGIEGDGRPSRRRWRLRVAEPVPLDRSSAHRTG